MYESASPAETSEPLVALRNTPSPSSFSVAVPDGVQKLPSVPASAKASVERCWPAPTARRMSSSPSCSITTAAQ